MQVRPLWTDVLDDEALTRGLGDPEAKRLVEWLVDQADQLGEQDSGMDQARQELSLLRRRGRAIARFVRLWCHEGERGAAGQLAVAERFHWPLPSAPMDPCQLMEDILAWEASDRADLQRAD
jgi:hypothetical protein